MKKKTIKYYGKERYDLQWTQVAENMWRNKGNPSYILQYNGPLSNFTLYFESIIETIKVTDITNYINIFMCASKILSLHRSKEDYKKIAKEMSTR